MPKYRETRVLLHLLEGKDRKMCVGIQLEDFHGNKVEEY